MTDQRTHTLDRIASCEAAIAALDELHSWPDPDRTRIASYYDDIRQGTQLARVHALVYIGDQIGRLVDQLDDGRLSADEVDSLIQQRTQP